MLQGMCLNWANSMDRWHASASWTWVRDWVTPKHTPEVWISKINTRLHITSNRTTKTKKIQCLQHWKLFTSVAGMNFGTWKGRMSVGGNNRANHDINLSIRRSCIHRPKNCPSTTIIAFSCVENRALGWCGQLAFRLVNENCFARLQACVLWGVMSPGMCELKQE